MARSKNNSRSKTKSRKGDSQQGSENGNKRKGWRGDPEGHRRAALGQSVRGDNNN